MKNPFKQLLLQFNTQDPTINTKVTNNQQLIDLVNFQGSNLMKWLWNSDEKFGINVSDEIDIQRDFAGIENQKQFEEICERLYYKPSQNQIKNFKEEKVFQKVKEDIIAQHKQLKKRFNELYKKSIQLQIENNIYPLYIGAYYLNGEDLHGQPINAPLLLWEVSFKITSTKIVIYKNSTAPTMNQKLLFYLKNNFKTKTEDLKTTSDFKKLPDMLSRVVEFDFKNFDSLEPLVDSKKDKLTVIPACVVTIVEPLGGCIKQDVETILEREKRIPIKSNTKFVNYQIYQKSVLNEDGLIELTPLNLYQRLAIVSGLQNDTLIYGPPGTGKSETIASLIANILYRDKSILISSEKQAALDVLKERLGKIAPLCLYAFKPSHADDLYKNLNLFSTALSSSAKYDDRVFIDKHLEINKQYCNLTDQLIKFNKLQNELHDYCSLGELFKYYQTVDKNQILKLDTSYFDKIKKYFTLRSITIDGIYREIVKLQELVHNRIKAVEILGKYKLKVTRDEVMDFLQEYESKQFPEWMLYTFITSKMSAKTANEKKPWLKEPKIKHTPRQQVGIIKTFEAFIQSDLEVVDFSQLLDITAFPHFIRSEVDFKKYFAFALMREIFSVLEYRDRSLDDFLHTYRSTKSKLTKGTDEMLFARHVVSLKNLIEKDKNVEALLQKLFQSVNAPKRLPINQLIKENYEALRLLFPIWVLSPIQAAVLNPCKAEIFDYGIFDEASQMFLENAIPLLYRVKIAVVAGDNKQLQPSAFFVKRNFDEEDWDEESATTVFGNSLFEQANINLWPKFNLKNHYRSQRFELIEFSSKNFYENSLEYNNKNTINPKPITLIEANGVWQNQKNLAEVEEVLKLIPNYANKKLLIITFNQKQADEVLKQFSNRFGQSKIFEKFLDNDIKIKSLENVQGDEADVVILSVSYAKDETNKVRQFFGPLSHQHGMNRLNVAITRAKEELIVIKSLSSDDVTFTQKNASNNVFKDFLKFIEHNSNNPQYITVEQPLTDIQAAIFKALQGKVKDCEIQTNVKIGKNILPIALINKKTRLVQLAITIVPVAGSNSRFDSLALIDNQLFLQDLGYPTLLLTELEFNQCPKAIIDKVIKRSNEAAVANSGK